MVSVHVNCFCLLVSVDGSDVFTAAAGSWATPEMSAAAVPPLHSEDWEWRGETFFWFHHAFNGFIIHHFQLSLVLIRAFVSLSSSLLFTADQVKKTMEATMSTIQDMVTVEDYDVSECFHHSNSMESVKSTFSESYLSKPSLAKRRANQQETEQFYFTVSTTYDHTSF